MNQKCCCRYQRLVALMLTTLFLAPAAWSSAARAEETETGAILSDAPCAPEGEQRLDLELAAGYQQFFSSFSAAGTMAALKMMPVDAFLCALKTEEPPLVLDVRTPGETGVIGFTFPGALAVPMDRVFTPEVLDKLADKKVVVVCQAGHRATAVALGLRHVGLKEIWILKGGTAALAAQLNPKSAY